MSLISLLGEGPLLWLVLGGGFFALIMIIGIISDYIQDCSSDSDDPDDFTDWPGP